ncbi:MAG: amylo-alpha-1,6-glucosidase [Eubacteriales bacterium]|nr:amylo-alpha-1,6-glucosidase [Eubacteriales bacterium]
MKVSLPQISFVNFNAKIKSPDSVEWLETSGDGSYASSTVSANNTRVYHGMLVSSKTPPVERDVLLQRIDDEIKIGDKNLKLSNVSYEGCPKGLNEDGLAQIEDFSVLPSPTWTYRLGENKTLKKQLVMPYATKNSQVVTGYTYDAPAGSEPLTLKLRPLVNRRYFHGGHNGVKEWHYSAGNKGALVWAKGDDNKTDPIYLGWNKPVKVLKKEHFYDKYYYQREADRGLNPIENGLYQPFEIEVTLKPGESFSFNAGRKISPQTPDINYEVTRKKARLEELFAQSGLPRNETMDMLQRAADQFIVHRNSIDGKTILAGYHWFNDWGRDTMIALPGLTLTTKRFDDAKSILETFAKYTYNGMLPNNFPEGANDRPGYNTIDASMWWFNALHQYVTEAGLQADPDFVKEQYKTLKAVVKHHMYGRMDAAKLSKNQQLAKILKIDGAQEKLLVGDGKSEIGMDKDGLITGNDGQLSWMDAATWNNETQKSHPFTPRDGKAVEINALWYNGLRIMADLADRFDEPQEAEKYNKLADMVKNSMQKFINPNGGLYDLIDTPDNPEYFNGRGKQVRPNQIIAAALPYCAFDREIKKSIVKTVEEKLLTPYGLRSLAPDEEGYAPYYPNGSAAQRDKVYHQGTVWTWQIGPFCDAYLKAHGDTEENRQKVLSFIEPILKHMRGEVEEHAQSGCCIGGIAEIFDATEPFCAKGTVNQAWSVSEVLRIYASLL